MYMKTTDMALIGIYEIEMRHIIARTGILSEHLGWTKQKTCRILDELTDAGMINRMKTAFFTLTKKGIRRADTLLLATRNLSYILENIGIDKDNSNVYANAIASELTVSDANTLAKWLPNEGSNLS